MKHEWRDFPTWKLVKTVGQCCTLQQAALLSGGVVHRALTAIQQKKYFVSRNKKKPAQMITKLSPFLFLNEAFWTFYSLSVVLYVVRLVNVKPFFAWKDKFVSLRAAAADKRHG